MTCLTKAESSEWLTTVQASLKTRNCAQRRAVNSQRASDCIKHRWQSNLWHFRCEYLMYHEPEPLPEPEPEPEPCRLAWRICPKSHDPNLTAIRNDFFIKLNLLTPPDRDAASIKQRFLRAQSPNSLMHELQVSSQQNNEICNWILRSQLWISRSDQSDMQTYSLLYVSMTNILNKCFSLWWIINFFWVIVYMTWWQLTFNSTGRDEEGRSR